MPEKMRDDESGSSNRKRPRESGYEADDDNIDARSHLNLKKPKQYVIVSDEEEEPGELEDDNNRDLDYNPVFNKLLFGDPRKT